MHHRRTVTAAMASLLILGYLLVSGMIGIESAYAEGGQGDPPVETPTIVKSDAGGLDTTSVDTTWVVIGGVIQVVLLVF